ncbi:MAG TPA: acylphosphatase [Bryobacteraceae bacterium]|nr:acylphosphatase [Bryobacteraceae bacterium]
MAKANPSEAFLARRYYVSGRVQGVGFRWFVEQVANELGLTGWTRNLGDGRVEVYATGPSEKLNELSGYLWKGPRGAQVRGVEELEAPLQIFSDFRIEYFS